MSAQDRHNPAPALSDGAVKRMLVTAGQVADFAYKQGVGEAIAVDDLIQSFRQSRAVLRDLVSAYMAGNDLGPVVARAEELSGGQQNGS